MAVPKESAHKYPGKRLLLGQTAVIDIRGKKLGNTVCDSSPWAIRAY